MANHCCEIVCMKCGHGGCVRGCGEWRDKSREYAKHVRKHRKEWLIQFKYSNKKRFTLTELINGSVKSGDICPNCNIPMVMD